MNGLGMTALLDPRAADRLAKLCGMFGSAHDGERASAAAMADKLVRDRGLTCPQILCPSALTSDEQIGFALANLEALTMWERGFIYSINGRDRLSDKQLAILERITAKARAYRESQS
jgi:hypothetical protein